MISELNKVGELHPYSTGVIEEPVDGVFREGSSLNTIGR